MTITIKPIINSMHEDLSTPFVLIHLSVCSIDEFAIPITKNGILGWHFPEWYNRVCSGACVLCFSEFKHANADVKEVVFRIAKDRGLYGHKLHTGTQVLITDC